MLEWVDQPGLYSKCINTFTDSRVVFGASQQIKRLNALVNNYLLHGKIKVFNAQAHTIFA